MLFSRQELIVLLHIIRRDNDYAREDVKADTDALPSLSMIMNLTLGRKTELYLLLHGKHR